MDQYGDWRRRLVPQDQGSPDDFSGERKCDQDYLDAFKQMAPRGGRSARSTYLEAGMLF